MAQENRDKNETKSEPEETQKPEPLSTDRFGRSSINIDPRIAAFLAYFLSIFISFLGGLLFFLLEKENRFIRFHSLQSVFFNAAVIIISIALTIITVIIAFVPVVGALSAAVIWSIFIIGAFVVWILLMVKSIQGEYYKVPLIGDWADRYV